MKLLAFETSTEACSVAVWVDGSLVDRHEIAPRRHAECALPWAEALLAEAGIARSQLDAVAVGRGPGAFTGVRLGVALAQGVALALDLPVVPVSTLAALALAAGLPEAGDAPRQVLATVDARMHEVYAGRFEICADSASPGVLARALLPESVSPPSALSLPETGIWHAVGTGLGAESGLLQTRLQALPGLRLAALMAEALPRAADVARIAVAACARGETIAPERLEPAYLRDKVALTLEEQIASRAAAAARAG